MKRLSQVAQAHQRSKHAREFLLSNCRPMECTEDKSGIVWERFVTPAGESLVLVATPHWWDVYAPVTESRLTIDVIAAIAARCAKRPAEPTEGTSERVG